MPGHVDGSDAAFAALYRGESSFVWRSVQRLGVPEQAAADAVQEVFIVARRRWAEFDADRASPRGWLYGIARGIASNVRRSQARIRRKLAIVDPPEPEPEPEHVLARAQALAQVEAFLAALDPRQREVFELVDIEGLRGPEVAALLGLELTAVYSRLRLARRHFVAFLAGRHAKEAMR